MKINTRRSPLQFDVRREKNDIHKCSRVEVQASVPRHIYLNIYQATDLTNHTLCAREKTIQMGND